MSEKVDNPSHRQPVQQGQPVQQAHQAGKQAAKMGIGNRPALRPDFGQLLQESMRSGSPIQQRPSPELPQAKERETQRGESRATQQQVSERGGQEAVAREVHRRGDSRDSSDSREGSRGSSARDSAQHAREAEQRVVGREGRSDSEGQKGSSGQEGRQGTGGERGEQGEAGARGMAQAAKSAQPKTLAAHHLFSSKADTASRLAARGLIPPRIPQKVLDQIVKYARLLLNKAGEKEMQLGLHEEVFKGLRLRITQRGKKVVATFVTSNREVHDLFLSERPAIRQALTEKGVDVEGIDVIMT